MKKVCLICDAEQNIDGKPMHFRACTPALRALVRAAVEQEPCGDPAFGGDLHRRALETNAATRRWLKEKEGKK